MSLVRRLLGRPLANGEEASEELGVPDGVSVFGLDALGSAAYGPEAALTVLLPLGLLGLKYILPLSATILGLLCIVFFSYLQTIEAYPNGGGAYTVAGENLGKNVGLLAGTALLLDYLLNVAVGISTGIGALVSAAPRFQGHTLALCLAMLCVLLLANLRGMRDSGVLWRLPMVSFVVCLLIVVFVGTWNVLRHGGNLSGAGHPPAAAATASVSVWLLLRSFASGCTALTGVEAVSNGVSSFREPKVRTAKQTLSVIVGILGILLMGVALLTRAYGITATTPGRAGYQSVLSLVTSHVMGRGVFYRITMASVLLVLSLSANTSFAGFPQVCHLLARDGYMPRAFQLRGRRMVYTGGIFVLAAGSALLLIVFGGVTDRLIPLFAVGAFLAFTFSQAGMVQHWRGSNAPRARLYLWINAVGAGATGVATTIVFVTKFTSGAWVTMCVLVPSVLLMRAVHRHYEQVQRETDVTSLNLDPESEAPLFLLPVECWNRAAVVALRFANNLGGELRVLHVTCDGEDEQCEDMDAWRTMLRRAADASRVKLPELVEVRSEYRAITGPLFFYVAKAEREHPQRMIAVVFPELVASRWYEHALHNYRSVLLKVKLFTGGCRRVTIMTVPWHMNTGSTQLHNEHC